MGVTGSAELAVFNILEALLEVWWIGRSLEPLETSVEVRNWQLRS